MGDMIETRTEWDDSGYDCDHCGGEVFKRTDHETGQPTRVCYQCKQCGCQWLMSGDVSRVGHLPACKVAKRERANEPAPSNLPTVLIVALVALGVLILTPFRGLLTLHWLIPVAIAAFVGITVLRLGRERAWW